MDVRPAAASTGARFQPGITHHHPTSRDRDTVPESILGDDGQGVDKYRCATDGEIFAADAKGRWCNFCVFRKQELGEGAGGGASAFV